MRIAYFTTDEVNHTLAVQLTAECGAVVRTLLPKQVSPDSLFDAVLYDLDSMPKDERSALLERLCSGQAGRPAAVHGYGITIEQVRALNQAGVAAARRLHPRLLRRLLSAVRRVRETVPADDSGTELTWVNLVS
jgi:hypothetical protein